MTGGVLDVIAKASPSRRSVTLCLDGSKQAEWDAARAGLDDAAAADAKGDGVSLANPMPNVTAQVEKMEKLRAEMQTSEVTFLFERMPWTERVDLQSKHPPREKNIVDLMRGYNIATFAPELIRMSCILLTGVDGDEVDEIPDATWVTLLGEGKKAGALNFKQVDELVAAANDVNDGATSVPPSALSLLANRTSGESSKSGATGPDQARNGRAGGSPRTARKSTTTKRATSKARSAST